MPSASAALTQRDARHERILDATEYLIAKRGYDGVRLIDVADEADVSVGSLQHRFRSRERLLHAAFERSDTRERERWIAFAEGIEDPWDRLLALIDGVLHMNKDDNLDGLWFELNAAARRSTDLREIVQRQNAMWAMIFTETVASGLRSGRLSSPLTAEQAGQALLGLIDGFYVARHAGDPSYNVEANTEIAMTVVRCLFTVHDVGPHAQDSSER